jgi:hypothetical protein
MKVLIFIPFFFFSLSVWCAGNHHGSDTKFEFSKSVFKIKGTIKKADGNFIIVPDDGKGEKFVPAYLPDEYKKNGLEVTFDGELGTADKAGTPLNIHKIWVAYELKEKYKLNHKSYDLN